FVKDRESLKKVVYAISLGGGLAGCIGVGQVFLMHYGHYIWEPLATVFNPFWGLLDSFLVKIGVEYLLPKSLLALLPHNAPIRIDARASSTFTNPIFLASYMVMTLPFAVYSIGTAKRKRFKALAFLCVVAIVGGVAGSYSRAPYLALGVTVFIMLFMGWKYALSVLAATPAFLIILPSGVYKRLLTLLDLNDGSIVTRADVWSACMETFRKKWLIGLGPGVGNTRQILINQYGIFQPHAHSLFLQLYLEGGVIGGTLFLALIVWIFVDIIILYARSKQNRPLAVTFFASLTGFLVCGITDYVLYGPKILQFFMLFLGLVVAAKRIYAPKGGENES
ncbi:MAG TPA: O-antigen ligase family protein, partial [Clostridiales bacterium]|nr:O-antigen ligase family protein [Clostridiales bacterium]